ncbi:MAG: NAD(P)-dependent oxidoreductase, partial [Stellaceae bacterium]
MAILVRSTPAALARWRPLLPPAMPGREFRFWPELGDPAEIDTALVWQPEPGLLARLPNLRLIVCLGAGVDALLADPTLPRHVPIVRLVDPYMTDAMSEYVVWQVLRLHRQDLDYLEQQRAGEWRERAQKNACERPVGIIGFGTMGQDAGRKLQVMGFPVAGWGRSDKA